jgi:lipopolysaccharide/colanic/teichoic acid biosynthesis glycosyltransferase
VTPNHEDDYLPEGIYVCHASLSQTLKDEAWINNQVDAVIVGTDCTVADIVALQKITLRVAIPLVLHTLKFDWKAKEISIESSVDEYHVGFLDQNFIKRIRLIKRVKSLLHESATPKKETLSEISPYRNSWLVKRSFDIALVSLITLSLLPILLTVIFLLMLEANGSIITSSRRVGRNFRVFHLYKFKCISSGESKTVNLIHKFLKTTHLMGLPQLLNVLAGDLSFVGNYPIHERDAELLTKDETAWRFLAPAGITGLWRISRLTESRIDDYTKPDLEYALTNSIWLDIKILFVHAVNIVAGPYWMNSVTKKHFVYRTDELQVIPH